MRNGSDQVERFEKKLFIGTANFGQRYGLNWDLEGLSKETISEVFSKIVSYSNVGIDTSPDYGKGNEILGEMMTRDHFRGPISTKISPKNYASPKSILVSLEATLTTLNVASVDTVLFHGFNNDFVKYAKELQEGTERILDFGLASRVGLSCYTEAEIIRAKELIPKLSVFQVPENVIDRRLLNSKQIMGLHAKGDIFYLRSIFLQGLLLATEDTFPDASEELKEHWKNLEANSYANKLSKMSYCVAYAIQIPWASGIVVGVDSVSQLNEIVSSFFCKYDHITFPDAHGSLNLVDPRNWKLSR